VTDGTDARAGTGHEREAMIRDAQAALERGRDADALALLQAATAREPLNAQLWHRVSTLLLSFGRAAHAAASAANAVRLAPQCLEKRLALAAAHHRAGDWACAVAEYESAAAIARDDPRVAAGLAATLATIGSSTPSPPTQAAALARQLLVEAARLESAGQPGQALVLLLRVAQLLPGTAWIHNRIGCLLQDGGQAEQALAHYELAARLQPDLFAAVHNAAKIAAGFGLTERARGLLTRTQRLQPLDGIRMRLELLTEAIHPSAEAILAARARFEEGLDRLLHAPLRIEDPLNKVDLPTFYLAYHGLCNRDLHAKLARAFLRAVPDLDWQAPHCRAAGRKPGRIRIGFISQFLRTHSIGKVARGLIARLQREEFEVYVLNIPPLVVDDTTRWIQSHCDYWLRLPGTLAAARAQIAALELDVLFYQDIGMEPFSYLLAHARLARVQCVSYGHPDTTGIPNMDYYVSNDLYEPPGAAAHYSERLVELHGLPTLAYYFPPQLPQPLPTRAELGLPEGEHLYVCPQSLFKLHPDFDALLERILERDGAGRVLLFAGECSTWSLMLMQRLRRTLPDVADRIHFLPRQPYARFLQLLSVADVVLDTVHFNGMNTSIDAFSLGTPVVTLPTALQRGRFTQAMYRSMGIADGVAGSADEYAGLAVGIAADPERRQALHTLILERKQRLFEDPHTVAEFERFFRTAHRASLAAAG
jgi:protein O-GlcNAc transferase